MCGIVGYYREGGLSAEHLNHCLAAMQEIRHRGPDSAGAVVINSQTGDFKTLRTPDYPADLVPDLDLQAYTGGFDLFLGHRRLSIIDLSSLGHQPMRDEWGNWLIFNGEVYNHADLGRELEQLGCRFRSTSDTEIILAALRTWGPECIKRFNGMWAFAFWDNRAKKLLLTNDRLSIKPLYSLRNDREFIFASEIKAFALFPERLGKMNRKNIQIFLDATYQDFDDSTFHENVFRFPSASWSSFRPTEFLKGENKYVKFWDIPANENKTLKDEDAIEEYNYLIRDAVKLRMRADVEWGVTLSGGLDSSTIIYQAHDILQKKAGIKTFSAVFKGQQGDESEFVELIRDKLKLDARFINPMDVFSVEDLEKNIWLYDYPSQGTSFYAQRSVMRLAGQAGIKVLLEGQGGDEVFAGYHHHFYRHCRELLLGGHIKAWQEAMRAWGELKGIPTQELKRISYLEIKQAVKSKLGLVTGTPEPQLKWNAVNSLREFQIEDIKRITLPSYLRTDDRDSMGFGIETRVPLLDYRVIEFGFKLPAHLKIRNGWQKYIMRQAGTMLDDPIRWRKDKKGFTTPVNEWVEKNKSQWGDYVEEVRTNGYEVPKGLLTNPGQNVSEIFRVFSLGLWLKIQGSNHALSPQSFREKLYVEKEEKKPASEAPVTQPVSGKVVTCTRCILSTKDAPSITFDSEGICNYCLQYNQTQLFFNVSPEIRKKRLDEILAELKEKAKGKKYDSILGVSGGVDSTYLAYKCKELGLNPLVIHFDNGWNSELAVKNIENILNKLGFELHTYVVNWNEFRDLQMSYIKAGVLDWEVPSDHGFMAVLFNLAWKFRIKTILTGHNYETEAILPGNMRWSKMDVANIRAIHDQFGSVKLKTFPILPFFKYTFLMSIYGIKMIPLLNYLGYNKQEAKEIITRELEWQDYGGKHFESIFTRFYQGYVLPMRFGVDKRKAHLSTLINSGQISRKDALIEISKPPYDPEQAAQDFDYVIKKFGLTEEEFRKYLTQPIHSHLEFASYETGLYQWHKAFFAAIRPFTRIVKAIFNKPLKSQAGVNKI